jgi:hypothetical protein
MSVIVLTANGFFWDEVSDLGKVIGWMMKDKIEVLRYDDNHTYRSAGDFGREGTVIVVKIPLVVRLMEFAGCKVKDSVISYSSEAVYDRDHDICQYFHEYILNDDKIMTPCTPYKYRCTEDEKSIDHIIPISKGGKTDFLNCVTCCKNCNERIKKNHLPKEAGLRLIRQPFIPTRKVGELWMPKFTYNPHKIAHKAFYEVMGWQFSHKV